MYGFTRYLQKLKMDNLALSCGVCEERYSSNRIPRNVNCGHSFCTACLEKIFLLDKLCPECRRTISGNQVSELPVNYAILRMSDALDSLQIKDNVPRNISVPSEAQVNVEKCKTHGSPLFFCCMRCQVWICRDCTVLDHRDPPRGPCQILSAKDALKIMKVSYKESLTLAQYSNRVKCMNEMLDKEATLMNFNENYLRAKYKELQSKLREVEKGLQTLQPQKQHLTSRRMQLTKVIDSMVESEGSVDQATTLKELETAKQMMTSSQKAFEEFASKEKNQGAMIGRSLLKSSQDLLTMLNAVEVVYATFQNGSRNRWAKVAIRDNHICLYTLRDGNQPSGGVNIPYECIREMVPKDSPSIFMEVNWNGAFRGHVYTKMYGNTPRSRQATFLCSGERGPSYRNTVFYSYEHKYKGIHNLLRGGDYEKKNGLSGQAIVDGIIDGGASLHKIKEGLMVGWPANETWHGGSFNIYLSSSALCYDSYAFGRVTNGLEILLEAAKIKPITHASVTDCGLVIPL